MTEAPTATQSEPSLGELVAAATKDMSVLVRSEIELAKLEMTAEAKKAAMGGGAFGGAAVFGLFGLIMGSFAAAYGLDKAMPTWAAFLVVTGAYLFLAAVLGLVGLSAVKKLGPPERTLRTTKETVAALKNRGKKKNKKAATVTG
jgi:hypothetical protein